ncbi:MAG: hypothetical protein ABSH21_09745 [Verrucomicrobiia bacterium]
MPGPLVQVAPAQAARERASETTQESASREVFGTALRAQGVARSQARPAQLALALLQVWANEQAESGLWLAPSPEAPRASLQQVERGEAQAAPPLSQPQSWFEQQALVLVRLPQLVLALPAAQAFAERTRIPSRWIRR